MILRDPVHGLVAFERGAEAVVPALLDTPELQRLRRVRALGVASLAFPGAEHSRFAHAVGAAHVMSRFLERVAPLAAALGAPLTEQDRADALAAALVHDVGHGPLSHLFEDVFEGMPAHELWTSAAVLDPGTGLHRALAAIDGDMPSRVERLVHGVHPTPFLARAVSGTFDVDRCDYLLRDSYMTGTRYGLYDLDWLLRSLRLEPSPEGARLAVDGDKGLPAVEGYFLARLFMYQQVYFHKATRSAEAGLRALFRRVGDLIHEGATPAGTPGPIEAFALGRRVSTAGYLTLDDHGFWRAVSAWAESRDRVLADLARRSLERDLFKTAPIDEIDASAEPELVEALSEVVAAAGFEPRYYVALDRAEVSPYERPRAEGEALTVVRPRRAAQPLEEASFIIGRLAGSSFVRRRLVFPGEARDAVESMLRGWRAAR